MVRRSLKRRNGGKRRRSMRGGMEPHNNEGNKGNNQDSETTGYIGNTKDLKKFYEKKLEEEKDLLEKFFKIIFDKEANANPPVLVFDDELNANVANVMPKVIIDNGGLEKIKEQLKSGIFEGGRRRNKSRRKGRRSKKGVARKAKKRTRRRRRGKKSKKH